MSAGGQLDRVGPTSAGARRRTGRPGAEHPNDSGVMMMAAVNGDGLAYTVDPTAAQLVAQGKLQRVLEPFCPSSLWFFLYFPSRAQMMPKLRAFVDYARSHLAGVSPRGAARL